jgi:hypothetical protein
MPWLNNGASGTPLPQAPAAAPPAGNNDALFKYLSGQGPLPPEYAGKNAAPAAEGGTPPLLNPAQAAPIGNLPAAAPPPPRPPSPPPGVATVPGTMPPPMAAPMPQMYAEGNLPANQQMQQMPGGMYVAQGQAPAAQQAMGLSRLPGFNQYLQQQRMNNGVLPGAGDPQAILKQYLALQGVQSQGDKDATQRMDVSGNLGVSQGNLALEQQKQGYAQGQGITDAAKVAVLSGAMSNPNTTPESFNQGIRNVSRLFPGQQPGAAPTSMIGDTSQGAGAQPPAGGQPQGNMAGLTGSEQLLGPDLAAKIASSPDLKAAGPRAKFDFISQQKGPDWVRQNMPALTNYLAEGTPGAVDQLRASAHPGMVEQAVKSPFQLLGAAMQTGQGPRAGLWTQQGRQKLGTAMDTPIDEQLGNFLGNAPTQAQNNSALLRALMP